MEDIKLKAGLEIHQQLNTNKLFCNCPSILRSDEPKMKVERKLNPVVGETGEIDIAAAYEKLKDKTYIYEVYDTTCLVELDEEPPHQINKDAIKIALQIATLMNCKIFPVTQIMRKTVIDGSNTSGFQRTALIAHDGFIETSEGKVRIDTIAIEEDAARIVSHDENTSTFRLDRLGIPLVEITTAPDLKSPEQIKEAALKIGEILRACNVKRGIGTIRQDVNISIKGSKRVEIKGFQDPKAMIKTIENEIRRQQKCLEEKACKNEVRKAHPDATTSFLRPMPGAARMYPETDHPLIKISKQMLDDVKSNIPKLASEHKSFLKEFGLNEQLVKDIVQQSKIEEFKTLSKEYDNYNLIAKILTIYMKEIAIKTKTPLNELNEKLNTDILTEILQNLKQEKLNESDVKQIMNEISKGKKLKQLLEKETINPEELQNEVKQTIKSKPGLSQGAYMGLIIAKLKGKASGKEIAKELSKQLKSK
jgi:Glu-tRNA(Gln) amidotransferase subunit E-like FAD-binding protein